MAKAAARRAPPAEKPAAYETAGAAMLARQASDPPLSGTTASADWNTLRGHVEQRYNALRTWRQSWWTQNWSDLAEFILPRGSIWLTQSAGGIPTPNNMVRGRPINTSIADPTATHAVRVCAAGLMSGLASPSRPWFKVVPAVRRMEIDANARSWLDEIEDRLYTVLASSNFYNQFAVECEQLVVFGTGPSLCYEDVNDLVRFYNPVVGEYYLGSGATMRIDAFYRAFVMTVAQIIDFFKVENCSAEIQKAWITKGNELEKERIVCHSIEPNFGIGPSNAGKLPGGANWREVYWLYGGASERPLSLRGFIDQPFTAARWSTQSNDAYGRSPGMDVLPDVMQLQVMTRRLAEAIEKQVRPPLVADMQLKHQPSSSLPGHVTYVQGLATGTGMRPIFEVMPDINGMTQWIGAIQKRIQVGLFNDLFLMLEQGPKEKMTAYEVAQKVTEKLQVLGPVIESLLSESLNPKLKRVFSILQRKGMISPPPDSLRGVPLAIQFVSILALAQKAAATGGIERMVGLIGSMAGIYPEVKDVLNPDVTVREFNELLGNPEKILRGPEEVAMVRQQAAQAVERQQKMAELSQVAEAAGKMAPAAQVLANTPVGGGASAIGGLLGGQPT